MSIINPAPDQYQIGKGRFHFAQYDQNGNLGPFRFIGNVPSFTITPATTTLEHVSSLAGLNVRDRVVVTGNNLNLAFTTDNLAAENKALWMNGAAATQTTTALTAQTTNIASVNKGYGYPLGVSAALPAGAKDITVTSVMKAGTTLVAGTDYVVNSRTGNLVFLVASTAVMDGDAVVVTWSSAAATRTVVTDNITSVLGAIKFISDNPYTGSVKIDYEHYLPKVLLTPNNDWALIGDIWETLGFSGAVLTPYDAAGNQLARHIQTALTLPAS